MSQTKNERKCFISIAFSHHLQEMTFLATDKAEFSVEKFPWIWLHNRMNERMKLHWPRAGLV